MIVVNIILGLIGLGIVVFFHELGHFLAARLVKIDVEAFSIGWGKPILKKKIGSVEYRLGMFPVGGYCKMRGDTNYNEAWENMKNGISPEKGTYLASSPLARIIVCIGGPLFNLLFAIVLLSFIWGAGFEINTLANKIILASDVITEEIYPADIAGLKTGDRIIGINGKQVSYYHEIQEIIALNPNKNISVTVDRNGEIFNLNVTPSLDRSSGIGRIGIYFWANPVIETVFEGSPAHNAGLRHGDRIISANNIPVQNNIDFMIVRDQNPHELVLEYERNGIRGQVQFNSEELKSEIGFSWETISYRTPNLSFFAAIAKGIQEGYRTLSISISSLRVLFMGIDLTQAVSGPVRITYMMGDVATQGFGQSFATGLRSLANFLALISIALCVMNMLPLPIIDGGMIILYFAEMIHRKPIHPKIISVFNACGMVIIAGLMILALFGDILFFIRR